MEIDMHQTLEGSPRKEVEGSCARGWRELISNIFNCIAIIGIVIRRALSWERPREQVNDYKRGEDNFDSISTMSGASNDSNFTITALEDSYTPFHDFGEMGSRNAGQKRRDPYAENFYNFDGKYATISNEEKIQTKPNKIDIRGGSDGEKPKKVTKKHAVDTVPQADVEPVCLENVPEVFQAEVESRVKLMKEQKDLSEIHAGEKPNNVNQDLGKGVESIPVKIVDASQEEGTPVDPVQVKVEEKYQNFPPAEPVPAPKEETVTTEIPHTPPKYDRKPNRQRKEKLKDSSKRNKHFSPSFSIDPKILPQRGDDMLTFQLKFLQQLQTVSRIASQETQEPAETEMSSDADDISNESLYGDSDTVPHLSDDVSEPDPEILEVSTESPTKEPLNIIPPDTSNQRINQGVAPVVKGKAVKTNPTFFVFNNKPTSPSSSSDETTPVKRKLKANRKLTPGKRGKFNLKFPQLGSNCFQRTKSKGESDDDSESYTKTENLKNDSKKLDSEITGHIQSVAQDHTAQETVQRQPCVPDKKDQTNKAPSSPINNVPTKATRSNQIKPFPKDDTKKEPINDHVRSQTNAKAIKMSPCKLCKPVPETFIETNEVTNPNITREVNFFYLNEFNRPVILKAVHGDKIYHLKLKTHSRNKIDFIAYIPHQESQKTLPPSRIPVLNPRDNWDFGVRIQNGDGKRVVFQLDLIISVKINGKRLNIPVEEPNIIKLTREFIAYPKSSDVNPHSLGQYILNMSFSLLELIEEHKQSLKEKASSFLDHQEGAEKPEVPLTSSAAANNKVSHSYARKASRIMDDIEVPKPFQDEYYAERTEQLLARMDKNAKAYHRKKVEKPQNVVKTYADKFTEIDCRYLGEKATKRLTCETRESIGFVPKNEKWIQVDMDTELWKEFGAHHGEPLEGSMYSFQVENFDIGAYRIDECVAVEKAKKGQVEILAGKQKVKTRGIPNKHLDKHSQEDDLLDLIMDAGDPNDGEEQETVFGNPELNDFYDQKPIFMEDETTDLDIRHIEATPCKILQKRRSSDPITPVKNKNKKKKHRAHTGPKDMNATQLAQKMFNFSQPYEPINRPRN